ncbi:methyltransferase family protein [Algoriphagus sanaruensis]|uniref:Lipid A phosphate methyltransferase n=1 Tax=Algoriphagus sanaruensis TaxID=1727163 RepID=A0A142ERV6_9BACT|nr:isoprenylcysteine carboxylmethyltransferase family protein [Algoriphagus sanaruensis]AMQ57861.1 lipid A phosphate methyltransferase [Algoriphagus sanaruensis]
MALQEELESQGNWLFKYRSFLPLVILILAIPIYLRRDLHPEEYLFYREEYASFLIYFGLAVGLAGLIIRIYTVGHTPKNTSGRNTKEGQLADTLNTTGIYSVVRHPLYLGNFLMWLGPAILTGHLWFILSFILMYWVYYERIMFAEEQFLRKKFGDQYLEWSQQVPAFIPKWKGFKKSNLHFSWKKVLRKEKNGLFALFLIFCAFDICGVLIHNKPEINLFLASFTTFTGILYFVLKVLKRKTTLLNEVDR